MANRHKKFAKGGRTFYSGVESNVAKEAEEKKHGGKVKKHVGAAEGKMAKHRRDRKRASGGRVGSDKSPLSSAHHGGKAGERAGGHAD